MFIMNIAIIGAGAVGGYFGARLRESGAQVTLVARGETLQVVKERGVRVTDAQGVREVPVPVVGSLHEVDRADVVLVATKALGGGTPARELFDGLPRTAIVATTQNAVEAPHQAAGIVGSANVWPGVVRGFFIHTGPASVEYRGGPLSYTFGTWGQSAPDRVQDLAVEFAAALNTAGIEGRVHPDIWVDVWEKAMFVTTFGGLGAFVDKPLGVLRTDYRSTLEALMREVADVARADGVALPPDAVERTMIFADRMPEASTSSMQRDISAGGDSELDAQVGAIVRAGKRHGVDVRLHDFILTALRNRGSNR